MLALDHVDPPPVLNDLLLEPPALVVARSTADRLGVAIDKLGVLHSVDECAPPIRAYRRKLAEVHPGDPGRLLQQFKNAGQLAVPKKGLRLKIQDLKGAVFFN